jgi:hypothetical protein
MTNSESVLIAIEGSLVPLKRLAILPLLFENRAHVADSVESGRVVLSECLLAAVEGSLAVFHSSSIFRRRNKDTSYEILQVPPQSKL